MSHDLTAPERHRDLRVLLIEPVRLHRDALASLLGSLEPAARIVGAGGMTDARRLSGDGPFDLVLLDATIADVEDQDPVAALRDLCPGARVVLLAHGPVAAKASAAHPLAACVISRDTPGDLVWQTIRARAGLPPGGASPWLAAPPPEAAALSAREAQVAELLVAGHANKQIADILGLADITVRLNLRKIFRKIGARRRTDAVRILLRGNGGA